MKTQKSSWPHFVILATVAFLVVSIAVAVLARLVDGREFTDDLQSIHYFTQHPFVLIGHNAPLLEGLSREFRAYPPLQPLLIALAVLPFRVFPDFWSHRLASAAVLIASCGILWSGRFPRPVEQTGVHGKKHVPLYLALSVQFLCAAAVWAQLDDAVAALVVSVFVRFRARTASGAILAAGALVLCGKVILLPVALALLVRECRSVASWKWTSTVLSILGLSLIFLLNRLTLGLIGRDALLSYNAPEPAMGIGLTSLLWVAGFHVAAMASPWLPFGVALVAGVFLAVWRYRRTTASKPAPSSWIGAIASAAGKYALVLSLLLLGFSQAEYFLWAIGGWFLLSIDTPSPRLIRQITMLSVAGAFAWGNNICYGLLNAAGGAKLMLLQMALSFINRPALQVAWFLCTIATVITLFWVISDDFITEEGK